MTVEKLITDHIDIWSSALQTRSAAGRGSNGKIDLYGIKKLRELILELAVRGKLVPQDPNDEPASELLKRIAAEWEWVRLGFITNYGECDKAEPTDADADTWIVELEDIEKSTSRLLNRVTFSERPFKSSKNKFNKNDVLYGKLRPYLDKVLVADDSGVCTTEIIPIKVYGNILPGYLRLLLKSPRFIAYANESTHGMNLPRLGTDKAIHAVVELTAIAEQVRIVNKVDELMSLCDQLEQQSLLSLDAHQQLVETLLATLTDSQDTKELSDNWARISQYFGTLFTTEASIDALKQTILQLAVMGKLVPQDPNDEPAFELLKRIEQEKAELVKQGKIKKQKPLPPVSDEEKPFELPVGWGWVRLGDIGTISGGGTPSKNNEEYWLGDIPWLSPKDMKVDYISTAEFNISELAVANSSVRIIPNNSILFVVRGMILAHTFPVAINKKEVTINQDMKSITSHLFNMDFLLNLMKGMSRNVLSLVDRSSHGTCKLVSEKLFNLQIPLPPLSEQSRINNRIEELVSLCDTLKSRLQSAQQTQLHLADALTDAALN
ncbi:TPA: restriction endonuclease subunit S [Morganella morganii]|nr:restriction endonuclease subunit S [Morganella morganii]